MARKKKEEVAVEVTTTEAAEVEFDIDKYIEEVMEGIMETVTIFHQAFEDIGFNSPVVRAGLAGAINGYLQYLLDQEAIAGYGVSCDEDNNYEDDEVPFVEVNIGFDPDNKDDYISFAVGSDEAIEEWNQSVENEQ